MTPQGQELVEELFDRLANLENAPRDPEAERVIANGLRRAPHAVYALVQTALVQDEALKRANARIEELQAQLGGGEQAHKQGSFLDSMREAVLGRHEPPTVRSPATQTSPMAPPPHGPEPGYPPQLPTGPAFGSGGSFLGTAASTAAGVIGGGLLLNSIRSMFGHHAGAFGSSASAAGIDSQRDVAERQRDQDQDQDQDQDDEDQDDQDQDQDEDQDDQDYE